MMQCKRILIYVIFSCLFISCRSLKNATTQKENTNILDSVLTANPQYFKNVLANKDALRVQIIYTKIDRDKNNIPHFTDYRFNVSDTLYFYPASTVKMPVALLAMEKLNLLKNPVVNRNIFIQLDSTGLQPDNKPAFDEEDNSLRTISDLIKKIFLVSDNDAYNHLYELLGQEYINNTLEQKGYETVQIKHRLQIALTNEQNRFTNAINFFDSGHNLLLHQQPKYSNFQFAERNNFLGKGYIKNDSIVLQPFNFSAKNRIQLYDLHNILRSVIFPQSVNKQQRFNLTENDYRFLYRYMSAYPHESNFPEYKDTATYYDAYGKFLLFGSEKGIWPSNIRIFSKEGDAYGFLTDVAYIADFKNNIEFMLSATIYCNNDGIFNDDIYDYETTGYPFMKNLGQVIYNYELHRVKKHVPNLDNFKIDYSKEY